MHCKRYLPTMLYSSGLKLPRKKLMKLILSDQVGRRECLLMIISTKIPIKLPRNQKVPRVFLLLILTSLQCLEVKCSKPSMNPLLFLIHQEDFNDTGHLMAPHTSHQTTEQSACLARTPNKHCY